MHADLQACGQSCCVNTVAKLMRQHGIAPKTKYKFRCTTDSNHDLPVADNILDRQFEPTAANQVWLADNTSIPTLRVLAVPGGGGRAVHAADRRLVDARADDEPAGFFGTLRLSPLRGRFRALRVFRPHCPIQTGTLNVRSAKPLYHYPRQDSNL
jgi:hypothetical protein